MQVITRDQVKAQLGLTDNTYDERIDAKLPTIDAKVKLITRNNWNFRFSADMTDTETTMTASALFRATDSFGAGINNPYVIKDVSKDLEIGQELEGDNIPTGAYITNIYKSGSGETDGNINDIVYVEISSAVTATEGGVTVTAGMNIAHHPTIAKGVWYLIGQVSTVIDDGSWLSRNVGPLQVSKSEMAAKVEGRGGMPAWFNQQLPRWVSGC